MFPLAGLVLFGFLFYACESDNQTYNPVNPVNQPPVVPSNPVPADSSTNISFSTILSWECTDPEDDTLTFSIALGTMENPPIIFSDYPAFYYDPDTLLPNTTYYWKITATDEAGNQSEGDQWTFETGDAPNQAPFSPYNPSPGQDEIDVPLNTTLTWQCSDQDGDTLQYDVYFGQEDDPPLVSANQADTSFAPALEFETEYFWKVVARDPDGLETLGLVWNFTTAANQPPDMPVPSPSDQAEDVGITPTLTWTCSDIDGDPLLYDVYFGDSDPPSRVLQDYEDNSYQPDEPLDGGTQYFWQVIAYDDHNNSTESEVWSFETEWEHSFALGYSGLDISMVWIAPGSFMMGAQPGEQGAMGDEYPRHEVTIGDGFWLGEYEVTQEQWEAIAGGWQFHFDGYPDRPAENVSWNSVQFFETLLNNTENGTPWRLPTEAEWEYACRAGHDDTRFWWGDDPTYTQLDNYAWYWDNNDLGNGHETHDVGTKLPNPWGLYDMNGNVWEWCEDEYHTNYSGAPTDGSAWVDQSGLGRIARGGGWGEYGAQFCRSAGRGRDAPQLGYPIFGFRMARTGN